MEAQNYSLITTLLLVFGAAITGAVLFQLLKLPVLLGYIIAGIVISNLVPIHIDPAALGFLSDIGVTLLLFSIGIEFSLHRLRYAIKTTFWIALAQLAICAFIFLIIFQWLSLPFLGSVYLAIAVSLSSTAIAVKYLMERGEMDTVPGEVATGWLAIQDFAVVFLVIILTILTNVTRSANVGLGTILWTLLWSISVSGVLLFVIYYLGKYGMPKLFDAISRLHNQELFLLSVIGIILLFSTITSFLNLSAPLGAFLAGLLIAETTQNHAVFAEIRPLRDIFAALFFVTIGLSFRLADVSVFWPALITIVTIVIFVKVATVLFLSKFQGFHDKTAFVVAVLLIPVSEFAFVLTREAIRTGALPESQMTLTVGVVIATILIGTPLASNIQSLYYNVIPKLLRIIPSFSHRPPQLAKNEGFPIRDHVVICGFGRVGKYIGRALEMGGIPYLVVDYNHSVVRRLREKGVSVVYGDPADKSVLDYAQVDLARILIIAIPDRHTQELVITNAQMLNKHIKIICRTHHEEDQSHLKSLGVQFVIQPEFEAALSITGKLLSDFGMVPEEISGKISRLKIEHGLG